MKQMKASVIIMAAISVLLITGSIISAVNGSIDFYSSALFLASVAAYTIVQIWCLVNFPFSLKKIGFYLCHVGVLVIIIGAVLGMLYMTDTSFSIPVDAGKSFATVARDGEKDVEFGFEISVLDFDVEKYEPDYILCEEDSTQESGYTIIQETVTQDRRGIYQLDQYDDVPSDWLKDSNGYMKAVRLDNGLVMIMREQADKSYSATMKLGNETVGIGVNKPVVYKGWKFYLMDYDHEGMRSVSLYAKNDPGNVPVGIGIWMVIAGTAIMCFDLFEKRRAPNEHT